SITTFASSDLEVLKATGPLNITMNYSITTNYLSGDPFLCLYLQSDEDTDQHYFLRLHYDPSTKISSAGISYPVMGTYEVSYYAPLPGMESMCESYLSSMDVVPAQSLFRELEPSDKNTTYSIYAGGALFLHGNAPRTVHIGSTGGSISFTSRVGFDCLIPAAHVTVKDIDTVPGEYPYDFTLYLSDKYGTTGEKIGYHATSKATNAGKGYTRYFEDIILPNPGSFYYLVKEHTTADYMSSDDPVLINAISDYVGDRLCVKKLSMTQSGKTHSIDIERQGTDMLSMTITDPDTTGVKYYLYGPYEKTFMDDSKTDGTFPGTPKLMTKSGSDSWTISADVPANIWGCYVVVKKVNNVVDRGYTINVPFHLDTTYTNGTTSMVWRVRPRASFVSKYVGVTPKNTAITSAVGGTKQGTIKWKRMSAPITGYELQICTSKKFDKNVISRKIIKLATTSYKLSPTKSKTTYYVRIRTFRKINSSLKVYSKWSKVKSFTTK
ncbi:MAG: fibronectin type III domain-containing protein, partial [Lachnospiraceae bacterium]|nr:fibronectin type III domain-containing protein [Lachnospiraceae bacterium]